MFHPDECPDGRECTNRSCELSHSQGRSIYDNNARPANNQQYGQQPTQNENQSQSWAGYAGRRSGEHEVRTPGTQNQGNAQRRETTPGGRLKPSDGYSRSHRRDNSQNQATNDPWSNKDPWQAKGQGHTSPRGNYYSPTGRTRSRGGHEYDFDGFRTTPGGLRQPPGSWIRTSSPIKSPFISNSPRSGPPKGRDSTPDGPPGLTQGQ